MCIHMRYAVLSWRIFCQLMYGVSERHRQYMRRTCHRAQIGGGLFCPDCSDLLLKCKRRERRFFLYADILSDDLGKILGDACRSLCEQDFQFRVDKIEVYGRIGKAVLFTRERESGASPQPSLKMPSMR